MAVRISPLPVTAPHLMYIAQSRNNGVKVRCVRPKNTRTPVACQVDRGGGWQDLPVLPQSGSRP